MKIGIVGAGYVGSTTAYALIMRGIGSELVLIDKNTKRRDAEVDDLYHAVPFASPIRVIAGDFESLRGAGIVIIAAGVGQKPGETRIQLLERNVEVFRSIIPSILKNSPDAILIVATNPVDIMTHFTAKFASELGLPVNRVFGTGTTLDTARFRSLIARHVAINPSHVHGYVLGEHGDSEVLCWSTVTAAGFPIEEFARLSSSEITAETRDHIDDRVRNAAYRIIEGKDATYYGIGSAIASIVRAILSDEDTILSVCHPLSEFDGIENTCIALPHVVAKEGIIRTFRPGLNETETQALKSSAEKISRLISSIS